MHDLTRHAERDRRLPAVRQRLLEFYDLDGMIAATMAAAEAFYGEKAPAEIRRGFAVLGACFPDPKKRDFRSAAIADRKPDGS